MAYKKVTSPKASKGSNETTNKRVRFWEMIDAINLGIIIGMTIAYGTVAFVLITLLFFRP